MNYQPTPWYSYFQLFDIFKNIPEVDNYESILFQLELWKFRDKLPAAVHATYLLLKSVHFDRKNDTYFTILKNVYAMSIVRTVNFLLDQEQDSLYAKSMLLMGKEANLPESIIKVRHRCSHGDIPDLHSLRLVCREAINYIYRKYWVNQCNLINSRINDEDHYSFILFSTLILARCGIDTRSKSWSKQYLYTRGSYFKIKGYTKGENLVESCESSSVISDSNRIIRLLVIRRYLSAGRHLSLVRKRAMNVIKPSVKLYYDISKILLRYCITEDLFISVFVEYVFSNYRPSQSHSFFLLLFYSCSKYSFNFTIKLVGHMLNFIFDINDMFTYQKNFEDSILQRIQLYTEVFMNYGKQKSHKLNHVNSENMSSKCEYKEKMNEWLITLLEYWNCLKKGHFSKFHSKYLKLMVDLPKPDLDRMLDYESTALCRIWAAASSLLPLFLLKVSSSASTKIVEGWKFGCLSHLIGLVKWMRNSEEKYRFEEVGEEEKNNIVKESEENLKIFLHEINKNLMPGTLWNFDESKILQTFPLDGTPQVSTHWKVVYSFEKIKNEEIMNLGEVDKKIGHSYSQMYTIINSLQSGKTDMLRIQKRMLRILCYFTKRFKTPSNNQIFT